MDQEMSVLRDVHARVRALEEARRLRAEADAALAHLRQAKNLAMESPHGSAVEQEHLREAAEASQRLARLREALARVEGELRRTEYLLRILSD